MIFGQLLFLCSFGKELNTMIPFIIGLMVGGFVGVSTMCLFQINRDERRDDLDK